MWTVLFGALLGGFLLAWFSPQIILWYFSPPADLAISCKPAVQWAMDTYRKVIFTGFLLGAIISSILFFVFFPKRKQVVVNINGQPPLQ
jgi:hypothetical protein